MAMETERVIQDAICARLLWETCITTDHNRVALEQHGASRFWVHRKGAMVLQAGELASCPVPWGRLVSMSKVGDVRKPSTRARIALDGLMSRSEAARKVSRAELQRQMKGFWFNWRLADAIRDEAPSAYKDIRAVSKQQHDLVKVRRTLQPLLNYKGT